ncbi:alpha/beta hydrolase family esterase [Corynebacterium auris]|uniref:alpha/beta hydrolase family esterase n=1 Tax=Corynebacterium auris TaxID=44750 RepID=UPI0025B32C44|nr:PHB depolymerase family esterase [Corynebacterium auris]
MNGRMWRWGAAALIAAVLPATACATEVHNEAQSSSQQVRKVVPEVASSSAPVEGERTVDNRTIVAADLQRSYTVSIPPAAAQGARVPLIFVFHGFRGDAALMRAATGFDRANAVVVYMNGRGQPDGKDRAWAPAPYAQTTGAQDLAFFDAVRAELMGELAIDPASVFATGLSNGGGFAAFVGCHRAHAVAAVATVSAAFYDRVFEGCSPIPVKTLDIHGTNDTIINYNGGMRHNTRYESLEQVIGDTARRNHCGPDPVFNEVTPTLTRQSYRGCDAPVTHYRIFNGAHVWPGASHDTTQTVAPDFATNTVLDFFGVEHR